MRQRRQHCAADQDLRRPKGEHRAPHHPKPLRPQFQPDQEQQHDDAERGDIGDLVDFGDQPQAGRADDHARQQIAEHAAEAEPPGQRHRDGRGGEQRDECRQHQ